MEEIELVIKMPKHVYDTLVKCNGYIADCDNKKVWRAIKDGTPLPEHYGRLIDADKTLAIAWHKFWKQEEEHEKTIEGYDILRDRFYEQEGFECCQQTIVNAETIIPATKERGAE